MVGFCISDRFTEHPTGPHHPERPDRIRAIQAAVREAGLVNSPNPSTPPNVRFGIKPLASSPKILEISPEPVEERWLQTVHSAAHIDHVRHVCEVGGGVLDLGDTPIGPASFEIALLAAGGVLKCCDAVMSGQARRAFAAVRPPGHHAEPDKAMGFCLFNNIAIAARYLQRAHGVGKIAIVDFDVHHGNGTQMAFEDDHSILFCSIHQHPSTCYPGTGHEWEIGTGPARGYTMNIPMSPGSDDTDYMRVIDHRVVPELDEFAPEVLLISAGFDAHAQDPLAAMQLTEEGFGLMTQSLVSVADRHCRGRVISALEGGYDLWALGRSVVRHIVALG